MFWPSSVRSPSPTSIAMTSATASGCMIVLLLGDLEAYERDPGLYVDPRTDLIGERISRPEDLPGAIVAAGVDEPAWTAFIARQVEACDGGASARFVERFLPA